MYALKAAQTYVCCPAGPHIYICAARYYLIYVSGNKITTLFLAKNITVRLPPPPTMSLPLDKYQYSHLYTNIDTNLCNWYVQVQRGRLSSIICPKSLLVDRYNISVEQQHEVPSLRLLAHGHSCTRWAVTAKVILLFPFSVI